MKEKERNNSIFFKQRKIIHFLSSNLYKQEFDKQRNEFHTKLKIEKKRKIRNVKKDGKGPWNGP